MCGYRIRSAFEQSPSVSASHNEQSTPEQPADVKKKSVLLALILSIIPGLGHIYIGKVLRGLAILVLALILPFSGLIWIFGFIDVYIQARKVNGKI